jgi:ATP-dependent Clp protease adaptor protein ClpS
LKTHEQISISESHETDVLDEDMFQYHLIVWNDDINTFEWVTKTLIEVCDHDQEQAEQCTLIIHYKGKCSVKTGEYEKLKPMCDGITDRGIGATIEELVS